MDFSRTVVLFASLYSACQGIIFVILSILSILSYQCVTESAFTLTPSAYVIYLKYYSSHHCKNDVNWDIFGIHNTNDVQLIRPSTTSAVERTFIISILYLIFNLWLTISSIVLYLNIGHVARRHLLSCLCISIAFLIPTISIFILDIFSAAYYSVDYARSITVDGSLTIMEIENRDEIRPILEKIDSSVLTFAPALMMYISLKLLIFFAVNILLMILILPSVWDTLNANRRKKFESERRLILSSSSINE